jgi:hypothetical protein
MKLDISLSANIFIHIIGSKDVFLFRALKDFFGIAEGLGSI